jgi:hypothetical protein
MTLSERFTTVRSRIDASVAVAESERAARDAFIRIEFEKLAASFAVRLGAVCGTHARLAVITNHETTPVLNRTFLTLANTRVEVTSTLYGSTETVRFTPRLDFTLPGQFGLIEVTLESLPAGVLARLSALSHSLFTRGIVMRGVTSAGLFVAAPGGMTPLDDAALEAALAQLFIRTEGGHAA